MHPIHNSSDVWNKMNPVSCLPSSPWTETLVERWWICDMLWSQRSHTNVVTIRIDQGAASFNRPDAPSAAGLEVLCRRNEAYFGSPSVTIRLSSRVVPTRRFPIQVIVQMNFPIQKWVNSPRGTSKGALRGCHVSKQWCIFPTSHDRDASDENWDKPRNVTMP